MYICENCGEVLEDYEVGVYQEAHPYGDGYAYEEWSCCPLCGGTDIVEAYECEECGEYFAHLTDDLCEDCKKEREEKE